MKCDFFRIISVQRQSIISHTERVIVQCAHVAIESQLTMFYIHFESQLTLSYIHSEFELTMTTVYSEKSQPSLDVKPPYKTILKK